MPVIMNKDETDARYMCDVCGVEIQNQTEGACCPACGRIFCLNCSAEHPITKVRVREDDSDCKKDEYMCSLCFREWRRWHPFQVKLSYKGWKTRNTTVTKKTKRGASLLESLHSVSAFIKLIGYCVLGVR